MKFKGPIKGHNMIELIIAILLFGSIMSLVGTLCVEGVRACKKGKNRVATQQEAMISIDRLCRELNETHYDTITLLYSTENGGSYNFDAVCFGTPKDNDEASGNIQYLYNGEFSWERFIIYYKEVGESDVWRVVMDNAGLTTSKDEPEALSEDDVVDCLDGTYAPIQTDKRKMANDIYNLAFTEQQITPIVRGINIKVISRIQVATDGVTPVYETTELKTLIRPWK